MGFNRIILYIICRFNQPKYSVDGLIVVMNLLQMYLRVVSINIPVEIHRWVLVKPNDLADV